MEQQQQPEWATNPNDPFNLVPMAADGMVQPQTSAEVMQYLLDDFDLAEEVAEALKRDDVAARRKACIKLFLNFINNKEFALTNCERREDIQWFTCALYDQFLGFKMAFPPGALSFNDWEFIRKFIEMKFRARLLRSYGKERERKLTQTIFQHRTNESLEQPKPRGGGILGIFGRR